MGQVVLAREQVDVAGAVVVDRLVRPPEGRRGLAGGLGVRRVDEVFGALPEREFADGLLGDGSDELITDN